MKKILFITNSLQLFPMPTTFMASKLVFTEEMTRSFYDFINIMQSLLHLRKENKIVCSLQPRKSGRGLSA
ncbi:hypothetical protein [Chryseobacterium lathyri]|uniref:Uncharacterized protein n=1 Tax=Chryseobacterium lathyri TaxID=395933 RepID=A0ABT9SS55_9FLAO|nr:hypothetical protein [Chryseobacterium lathyri]MDP9962281.1 hypothetical protein [Chryseobacterium lathyri]MDQ0067169.1 hypothetical protein [Chryseobacterium lathyri]